MGPTATPPLKIAARIVTADVTGIGLEYVSLDGVGAEPLVVYLITELVSVDDSVTLVPDKTTPLLGYAVGFATAVSVPIFKMPAP